MKSVPISRNNLNKDKKVLTQILFLKKKTRAGHLHCCWVDVKQIDTQCLTEDCSVLIYRISFRERKREIERDRERVRVRVCVLGIQIDYICWCACAWKREGERERERERNREK